tara:strand:+ start:2338 stop:3030 length:693 start_codon:yes stop_codon:yes gene_type:complete
MGFLDHSTNNIIIDAVLTDRGRELLAANDGSFRIVRYAFADDEVDYTIIKKFGRTIGREKIEKNTPVFEAQTSHSLALRYPIVSYSDPNLIALPTLERTSGLTQIDSTNNLSVTMDQKIAANSVTSSQRVLLEETMMQVIVDSRFLKITNTLSRSRKEPFGFSAIYDIPANPTSSSGLLSTSNFTLSFVSTGKSHTALLDSAGIVKTPVRVVGVTTGVSQTFEVTVKYTI